METQVGLAREQKRKRFEAFLGRVKGVFYYGTPHRGSLSVDNAPNRHDEPLLKYFQLLSTGASRMNSDFAHLCNNMYPDWRIQGLGESLPTNQALFKGVVVAPEACSRDGDEYNVVAADHTSISKPKKKTDRRFRALASLLHSVVYNAKVEVVGHQCMGLPRYPAELENRAQEVEKRLKDLSILGIFGMGGIGKTTLAKQVYNNISKEFEYTCFCDNVKGIEKGLADWVCGHFYRNGSNIDHLEWADLKGKSILIVLDDVDAEDQLSGFPELHHFRSGSKIIITSRVKDISRFYDGCGIYDVDLLEIDPAKKLFCKHAFGQEDIPCPIKTENLEGQVTTVVEKCGGLPLTLEVIGRYLRGQTANADIWKETIRKLGKAQPINGAQKDGVWDRLMVSYDALVKEEKDMFLEAGTIFFGRALDLALAAWSTGIGEPETRWANLVSRSMVKEDFDGQSDTKSKVWVHEHLRDLAKSLAKGPVISDVFQEDELLKILDAQEVKEETKAVWLHYSRIEVDSLVKLGNLKYLYVRGGVREGSSKVGENWLRRLSMLSIVHSGNLQDMFPFSLNEMKNLAVLEVHFGDDVPKGFSESLGNLTNLCILRLTSVGGMDSLPENFGNLKQLKSLILGLRLLKLPESLGQLSALEELTLFGLPCSELPESTGKLSSLRTLTLEIFKNIASLPVSFGCHLKSLKHVSIRDCPALECLPRSFSQCLGLEDLGIRGCASLKELGDSFGDLPALRFLTLDHVGIERLPESFGHLSALEELTLRKLDKLITLPDTFGQLTNLKSLEIEAAKIETLPESFGLLASLQKLKIVECENLKALPESLGILVCLQELTMTECHNLEALPESFGRLASLQELIIRENNLKALPESLADLARLKKVCLWEDRVKALPDSFGKHCTLLQELEIAGDSFNSLPTSMERLSSLQRLEIRNESLEKLPDIFGELSSLKNLGIYASSLENLPESTGRLQSMQKFVLMAKSMKTLPESLRRLSSWKKFKFYCDGIEGLPKYFDHLPFSSLALTLDCYFYGRLPDGIGDLSTLRDLTVKGCGLKALPDELGKLSSLRRLKFRDCQFESLPESLGCISSLTKMELIDCDQLETLPDTLGRPSTCPVAPRLKESIAENASSHPTATAGLCLVIADCKFLDESRMRSFGWVRQEAEQLRDKLYRRENACSCAS